MKAVLIFRKKITNKRFTIFLCFILLCSKVYSQELEYGLPENNGMSSLRLSNIDSVFSGYINNNKLPGAVILIARNGNMVYHKSFGMSDLENQVPMTNDKIFRIASQTKALVSVGIMMLQEEGKLLLSDSLSRYIPEFEQSTVEEQIENTKEEKQYRGYGDDGDLQLNKADLEILKRAYNSNNKVVVVLISGRPIMLGDHIDNLDALMASFLPGMAGEGIADVIFGEVNPQAKLNFNWPLAVDGTELLFELGSGLNYN